MLILPIMIIYIIIMLILLVLSYLLTRRSDRSTSRFVRLGAITPKNPLFVKVKQFSFFNLRPYYVLFVAGLQIPPSTSHRDCVGILNSFFQRKFGLSGVVNKLLVFHPSCDMRRSIAIVRVSHSSYSFVLRCKHICLRGSTVTVDKLRHRPSIKRHYNMRNNRPRPLDCGTAHPSIALPPPPPTHQPISQPPPPPPGPIPIPSPPNAAHTAQDVGPIHGGCTAINGFQQGDAGQRVRDGTTLRVIGESAGRIGADPTPPEPILGSTPPNSAQIQPSEAPPAQEPQDAPVIVGGAADNPEYAAEEIIDEKMERGRKFYLVRFVGCLEPEWCSARDVSNTLRQEWWKFHPPSQSSRPSRPPSRVGTQSTQ